MWFKQKKSAEQYNPQTLLDELVSNGIELNVDDTKTALSGKNVSIFISGEYSPVEWERRLTDKENARLQVRGNELYLDTKPLEGYLEFTQVKKTEIR